MTVNTDERPDFYPYLEAARGIAALMVVLFHIGLSPYVDVMGRETRLIAGGPTIQPSWGDRALHILGNGPGAVIFFFVLSGFVLTKVIQSGPRQHHQNCWQFLTARIFRIYPAVISTILILAAIFFCTGYALTSPGEFGPTNLILNLLLVRPSINSVMWSLQLELVAAPMLLLIYFAWLRFGGRAALLPYGHRCPCRSCRNGIR